jgi:hypothetical protein
MSSLSHELKITGQLGGGVVIHPGSCPNRKQGLLNVAETINNIYFPPSSTLLLENSAGQGNTLYTTLDELAIILANISPRNKDHVKICIDTCHLYAYGQYDISLTSEITRFWSDFDRIIGREKLGLIHFNDSRCDLGSRKDSHACIGTGYIWKDSCDKLLTLLSEVEVRPRTNLNFEFDSLRDNAIVTWLDECEARNVPILGESPYLDIDIFPALTDCIRIITNNEVVAENQYRSQYCSGKTPDTSHATWNPDSGDYECDCEHAGEE